MRTGLKFARFAGMMFLCLGCLSAWSGASAHTQRKTKKQPLAPLPNGPTGLPVPQIPLDSIASVPPQVTYQNGQLTIVAANSTLGDILRAVKKQTGADIEVPAANDRVVTHLGPGSARGVMADLLNGSRFNYVLLGSAQDSNLLTRVVLVAKTGPEGAGAVNAQIPPQQPQPMQPMQAGIMPPQAPPEEQADAADTGEVAEDNPDDNPDQSAADAEQQQQAEQANPSPDQQGVKTPQQMLQEMQQRQLQMQQQQQQGQVPGLPVPNRPPQEQQ